MKTIKQLNARSLQLGQTSKRLANDIHTHLVDIASFIKATGNVTPMTVLFNAIHGATRRDAIAKWANEFAGAKLVKAEDGSFSFKRNAKGLDTIDIDAAKAVSPWEFAPEKIEVPFDLMKMLASVVKRAEEAPEKVLPEGKQHNIPADKLAALKALLA